MEPIILVIDGAGYSGLCGSEMIVLHGPTADIYVGPPPIVDIQIKRELTKLTIPAINCTELRREPKKRDWEQRKRKRRK